VEQKHNSREKILQRIAAVSSSRGERQPQFDPEFSNEVIYQPIAPDPVRCFKNELEAISGKCFVFETDRELYDRLARFLNERGLKNIFCNDQNIVDKLTERGITFSSGKDDFTSVEVGITPCECLVARTGSAIVSSLTSGGRQLHVFPPVHIVVARATQITSYIDDALSFIKQKYGNTLPSAITLITGPSRTADIEKTLVLGAHGPKEFIVFLTSK